MTTQTLGPPTKKSCPNPTIWTSRSVPMEYCRCTSDSCKYHQHLIICGDKHQAKSCSRAKTGKGTKWVRMSSWKCPKWSCGFLGSAMHPCEPLRMYTEIAAPLPDSLPLSPSTLSLIWLSPLIPTVQNCYTHKSAQVWQLLSSHPKPIAIGSVCHGLREGFWPFTIFDESAPQTWDELCHAQSKKRSQSWIRPALESLRSNSNIGPVTGHVCYQVSQFEGLTRRRWWKARSLHEVHGKPIRWAIG